MIYFIVVKFHINPRYALSYIRHHYTLDIIQLLVIVLLERIVSLFVVLSTSPTPSPKGYDVGYSKGLLKFNMCLAPSAWVEGDAVESYHTMVLNTIDQHMGSMDFSYKMLLKWFLLMKSIYLLFPHHNSNYSLLWNGVMQLLLKMKLWAYVCAMMTPKKFITSNTVIRINHLMMASKFVGSIVSSPPPVTILKYTKEFQGKSHFSRLASSWCFLKVSSMCIKYQMCSS